MVEVFHYDAFQKTISPEPEGGPLVRHSDYAALEAQLAEMTRRRDEWRARAEGYDDVRLALREKVGATWNMSRALWAGIAADEKKRADDAEARISALEATPPAPSASMLSSLLARIHRDGGHYEAEHGTEKACADADDIVARLYATPPAPKVTEAMVETEMVRMTVSETIRAMGANPDEQIIGELTVFDAVAVKVRAALTAAQGAPKVTEERTWGEMVVCPDCDGQKLMPGYDCDCPRCAATGVVPLGTAIRSILDDDDADVFEKLADIRLALTAAQEAGKP